MNLKRRTSILSSTLFTVILFVLAGSYYGCTLNQMETSAEYIAEIEHWQQLRVDSLKGHTGFLNLAGLFWLKNGISSIGSDTTNTFIFPPKAADHLGIFVLKNDSVWFIRNKSNQVIITGNLTTDTTMVFVQGSVSLTMKSGDLHWFIIKRGTDYGIRLKDYNHPLLFSFNHIDNYPINAKWRVPARWEKYAEPKMVIVHNQVGMDLEQEVPGALHFELDGETYSLEPIGPEDSEEYFVMIYDKTSGHDTYGSGRYLDVIPPDEKGMTYIDFNKAYNPPCAYTEFATCLFPHEANRLPILVEAGEKYSGSH